MTYEELGAQLRAEREKRNLNIEDIAQKLKIGARQLRALENGDIQDLPHPAYARGFIRSYAGWLGISNEEIQQALQGLESGMPIQSSKVSVPADEVIIPEKKKETPKRSHKGLYFLLFLFLLGTGVWYAWDKGILQELIASRDSGQTTEKLPKADDYMAAKDAESAKADPGPKSEQELESKEDGRPSLPISSGNAELQTTVPAQEINPGPAAEIAADLKPLQEASAPQSQPPAQPAQPAGHKLIITAIEECWIHSNADKTDTRQFSLRKGDTFALTFVDSLELKLGNAGGVRLRYDGNDLPPPGTSGQVKTITFPPATNP